MEQRWLPDTNKEKKSLLATVNFILFLVIVFCMDYIFIGYLFR